MKKFLQEMSPEERSTYRRWQSLWVCIYAAVAVVLFGIASFMPGPRDTEIARSSSTQTVARAGVR